MTHHEAGGSGEWHEQLHRTLDEVAGAYRQLGALSRRLITGVENGEVEDLLDVLDERSACIAALEEITTEYEAGLSAFERSSSTLVPAVRAELMASITEIQESATALEECDAKAARLLEEHRRSISSEMSAMSQRSAAVAAYSGGRGTTPAARFQDREG